METKKEFVKEVKEILVNFFNRDYNYQLEEIDEDHLWMENGPRGLSLGFNIQNSWIGIYLEKEIPEVPAITFEGTSYESTLSTLKSNLNLLLREIDKVLKFYHDSVVELLKVNEDFEPCSFRLTIFPDGRIATHVCDYSGCKRGGGAFQDMEVTWKHETGETTVSSYRSYKRYVESYLEGYNVLQIARSKDLIASYRGVNKDNVNMHCLLINKSKEGFEEFPGWKSIMDPTKDLELFRSI